MVSLFQSKKYLALRERRDMLTLSYVTPIVPHYVMVEHEQGYQTAIAWNYFPSLIF